MKNKSRSTHPVPLVGQAGQAEQGWPVRQEDGKALAARAPEAGHRGRPPRAKPEPAAAPPESSGTSPACVTGGQCLAVATLPRSR